MITHPIPARMRHLPRDHRGYPIPVNVYRDRQGGPHFTINDEPTRRRQIAEDRCPICDGRLLRGRWFVGGPLSAFHPDGAYNDLPMHGECAHYALQVCPYLAMPSYTRRIDAATLKRVDPASRGDVLFVDPTMIPPRPIVFVAAMAIAQTTTSTTIIPHRPWRRIEFWQNGICLSPTEGARLVRTALEAGLPPQSPPRVIDLSP